jgi:hypothetical protein
MILHDQQLLPPWPLSSSDRWKIEIAFSDLIIVRHAAWQHSPVTQDLELAVKEYVAPPRFIGPIIDIFISAWQRPPRSFINIPSGFHSFLDIYSPVITNSWNSSLTFINVRG